MAYTTPAWNDNSSPAISAANLTAMGEGIELGGNPYGVCSTAAATATKTVNVSFSGTLALYTGLIVSVKFSNGNTAASPKLNVNGTGAKNIKSYGTQASPGWVAGQVVSFVYDGTNWLFNGIDAYTKQQSLSSATAASIASLTGTTPATPDEAFSALALQMGGQAQIAAGSYTGNGASGSGSPTSLTFAFAPKLVIISEGIRCPTPQGSGGGWYRSAVWIDGTEQVRITDGNNNSTLNFSASGNTLSWWSTRATLQLNVNGTTYPYFALG